jgi:hypothetical protein
MGIPFRSKWGSKLLAQTGTEKPSKGLLNRSIGDVKGVKKLLFFKVTGYGGWPFLKRAMIQVILNMNGRKATVHSILYFDKK